MIDTAAPPPRRLSAGHVLVPAGIALSLLPAVSAPWALLAGMTVALAAGNPYLPLTRRATRTLLAASVIGLGAGMDLRTVARVGLHGFGYTVVGISLTFALGLALSRVLRTGRDVGILVTVGTAICGGSAIAAASPVLRAEEHEVSVALATVFLLNAVALFVFPPLGHLAGLGPAPFGLWAALAIHDTSSVVGAALQYGPRALEVATSVKLARALWIVPVTLLLSLWVARRGRTGAAPGRPSRPWFILGFVAAAAIVTFLPAARPAGDAVAALARRTLVVTLFLVGGGLTRGALRSVGPRPLALGVALWAAAASLTLLALRLHLVAA